MDKLNIIETCDVYLPDVDGVVNCMHNYCLNICDKTELTVCAPKNKKSYVDKEKYNILRCKSIYIPILGDHYGLPAIDRKFKKQLKDKQVDIIHTHSPFNMSRFMVSYAKKRNIPIVTTFHSDMRAIIKGTFKSNLFTNFMVRRFGKLYNKFDEVFVCSPLVAEQARSYGYKGKITYLPFGTDLPKRTDVDELIDKANEEFKLEKDELVFLYLGRIMKLKRIDFILDSLKILKDRGTKFKFYAVGKGSELNKLKKHAKKLGFTENEVIFTGFLKRSLLPLIYARADLFLFPSIYDNFALVKVEAASYSTPGLYIKDSCTGYGVTDGVNGFLSENNVTAFADKIEYAISDRNNLKTVGENASRDLYVSWKDCSDVLLKRLTEIVREKRNNK